LEQFPRIAGVVVFYNPVPEFISNIASYSGDVETIFVIDNSEAESTVIREQLAELPKVVYVWNGGNLGIAAALNIGIERAVHGGAEYVLTMDQDSRALPGMIPAMLTCLEQVGQDSVGIVSPWHQMRDGATAPDADCEDAEAVMASGNLVNVAAYLKVGPFRDDYFIDFVDHEYCLRLRQNGYRVIRANRAVLKHRLGAMTWHRLFWKPVKVGNHPPLRRYYAFRNRLHLHRLYRQAFPVYFADFFRNMFNDIAGVILFEEQKGAKLSMMWRGYLDYRRGILGPFRERR
jgi:rhamnosyltransferase